MLKREDDRQSIEFNNRQIHNKPSNLENYKDYLFVSKQLIEYYKMKGDNPNEDMNGVICTVIDQLKVALDYEKKKMEICIDIDDSENPTTSISDLS